MAAETLVFWRCVELRWRYGGEEVCGSAKNFVRCCRLDEVRHSQGLFSKSQDLRSTSVLPTVSYSASSVFIAKIEGTCTTATKNYDVYVAFRPTLPPYNVMIL
jgi:hypothetical protein